MHYHLIVGEINAIHLNAAFQAGNILDSNKVICLYDNFCFGPLRSSEEPFSLLRTNFWNHLHQNLSHSFTYNDLEQILNLLKEIQDANDTINVHLWMTATARDLLAYYFILHYCKSILNNLHVININGLPFLDDDLKLFYPQDFIYINYKGIIKALKLSRKITLSEFEADADEWKYFQQHPLLIRILKGGKKIDLYDVDYFDQFILDFVQSNPSKKINRILSFLNPNSILHLEQYLTSRIKFLLDCSLLIIENGNVKFNT
jgi:hypothetical protein